jgi:hypothetical protein
MSVSPKEIAESYFETWKDHNFEAFHSLLADDATFLGPLGQANNASECTQGIKGLSTIVTHIDIQHMWVDGNEVITWYDLHTSKTKQPLPVVNWIHIENNKIKSIKVTFDPRTLFEES